MRELFKKLYQTGDFWGGIAAMLDRRYRVKARATSKVPAGAQQA